MHKEPVRKQELPSPTTPGRLGSACEAAPKEAVLQIYAMATGVRVPAGCSSRITCHAASADQSRGVGKHSQLLATTESSLKRDAPFREVMELWGLSLIHISEPTRPY